MKSKTSSSYEIVEAKIFGDIYLYKGKFGGVWIEFESSESEKTLTPYAIKVAEAIEDMNNSNKTSASEKFGAQDLEVYKNEGEIYIKFHGERKCLGENADEIAESIKDMQDYPRSQ